MTYKWVKRIARGMLPCFVFFVFSFTFAPKAHALQAEVPVGYGFYGQYYYFVGSTTGPMTNYVSSGTTPLLNAGVNVAGSGGGMGYRGDATIYTGSTVTFEDVVKIYASYYYQKGANANSITLSNKFYDTSTWECTYLNSNGSLGYVSNSLFSWEEMAGSSAAFNGKAYAIEAQFQGSEAFPISELTIRRPVSSNGVSVAAQGNPYPMIYFPSVRIITTQYTAEMEALDNVASEIAAQSDILLAMKGDLVAILQDIYQMTGDMYEAQQLLNGYVSQMLPLLQGLNSTTTNIYNLLSTQLRLLETAIENAADSVEAAIAAQTAAMIAFLESIFNTGNEVPDDTYSQQQDAANILDQMGALQKPDVNTVVPEIGDYTDGGVSGVLGAIFSSNLIVTMMTLSASFAFGAYVLFGKRE